MKKIIVLIMSIAALSGMLSAVAINLTATVATSNEIYKVSSDGHGSFSVAPKSESYISDSVPSEQADEIIRDHGDIYQFTNEPSRKLLRVKDDTFLEVSEVPIDLESKATVEASAADYELSAETVEALLKLQRSYENGDYEALNVVVYTPNLSVSRTPAPNDRYYVGYNHKNYKDEVTYAQSTSRMEPMDLKGTQQRSTIFHEGQVKVVPATTTVTTYAASIKHQYLKMTHIQIYDDYYYTAASTKGDQQFEFKTVVPGETWQNSPSEFGTRNQYIYPNYYYLDNKDYEKMIIVPQSMKSFRLGILEDLDYTNRPWFR